MNNKRSLIFMVFGLILVIFGFTFAYFSNQALLSNEFHTGVYDVSILKNFKSPDGWKPGDVLPFSIVATNNGDYDVCVRVTINSYWKNDYNNDTISNLIHDEENNTDFYAAIIGYQNLDKWILDRDASTIDTSIYYYYTKIQKNSSTVSLIENITFNPDVLDYSCVGDNDNYNCSLVYKGVDGYNFILNATVETVDFKKYNDVWDTSVVIE